MQFNKKVLVLKNINGISIGMAVISCIANKNMLEIKLFSKQKGSVILFDLYDNKTQFELLSNSILKPVNGNYEKFGIKILGENNALIAISSYGGYKFKKESTKREIKIENNVKDEAIPIPIGFEGEVVTDNYFENEYPTDIASDPTKLLDIISEEVDVQSIENEQYANENIEVEEDKCNDIPFQSPNFYAKIKENLDELFTIHPKEEYLTTVVPSSKWVSICYGENKWYSVGVIKEEGEVKYIGYAIPSKYSSKQPIEFGGKAQWLPKDIENQESDGYWMMYQWAEDGKNI